MPRHYVEVEVDLDDFSDDELLDELRDRQQYPPISEVCEDYVMEARCALLRGDPNEALRMLERALLPSTAAHVTDRYKYERISRCN